MKGTKKDWIELAKLNGLHATTGEYYDYRENGGTLSYEDFCDTYFEDFAESQMGIVSGGVRAKLEKRRAKESAPKRSGKTVPAKRKKKKSGYTIAEQRSYAAGKRVGFIGGLVKAGKPRKKK